MVVSIDISGIYLLIKILDIDIYSLKRVEGNEKCAHIVVVSKGRAFSRRTVRVIHLVPVVRATAHEGTSPEPIFFLFLK